ncbi:ABC transporter permease [Kaistia algarum]|uniref:ABC transporter permease n=1 Tax=Kaistia algarum TaxID=2083279 RepID=UPI000CE8626A|nr:ABC transporter permease [Kaistia algarum]MCX5513941.1 ABC transporter permease [Kaistia algarum]PPE78083.1 ABC transporter permease [Kaistia algarum]
MSIEAAPSPRVRRGPPVELVVNNILLIALVLLIGYFTMQSGSFLTVSNFKVILTNYAAIGVVASVMALLVIAGQVDMSVGSNIGFSGMVTAIAMTSWGMPAGVGVLIGVGTGALVGLVNGVLCAYLRFSPIIVTLGMLSVLRGATLLINSIEIAGLGDTFFWIGNGSLLGMPVLLWVVFAVFLLSAAFLSLTVWGRYVFAIGVNPQAAFLAALPVRPVVLGLYVATGTAAGLAGVLLAARLDGASPGSLGLQMELQSLTIVLLGGVAFAGGRGRIFGVFTAWVFLGVLDNGLVLLNVPPFVQLVASGLALVFAASLDALGTFLGPRLEQRRRVNEQVARATAG